MDAPVATVEHGVWGDRYPAIRQVPGTEGKVEAYMEKIDYGEIPEEESTANLHLIAAAPELYEMLEKATDTLHHIRMLHMASNNNKLHILTGIVAELNIESLVAESIALLKKANNEGME